MFRLTREHCTRFVNWATMTSELVWTHSRYVLIGHNNIVLTSPAVLEQKERKVGDRQRSYLVNFRSKRHFDERVWHLARCLFEPRKELGTQVTLTRRIAKPTKERERHVGPFGHALELCINRFYRSYWCSCCQAQDPAQRFWTDLQYDGQQRWARYYHWWLFWELFGRTVLGSHDAKGTLN